MVAVKFTDPVVPGMVLTGPDNSGQLGYRRLLVHSKPYGGNSDLWLVEDLPSRLYPHPTTEIRRCPEINLRIVFVPEQQQ